jgi:hypothetical protein
MMCLGVRVLVRCAVGGRRVVGRGGWLCRVGILVTSWWNMEEIADASFTVLGLVDGGFGLPASQGLFTSETASGGGSSCTREIRSLVNDNGKATIIQSLVRAERDGYDTIIHHR